MNWLEVALLIFGVGAFAGSFLVKGRKTDSDDGQQVDVELIRNVIEKEMGDAKERVTEVVDETLEYAVEKTERASERISNEKIMAISEYSETVLSDINKSHQEVMFLYDMLNDKHNNLKETVKHVDKTAKEAEEAANAAAVALAAKAKEEAEVKAKEKQEEEIARKEEAKRNEALSQASLDKAAREKEQARRQMARLILPVQQEMPMHRQAFPMQQEMPMHRQVFPVQQEMPMHRQVFPVQQEMPMRRQAEARPLDIRPLMPKAQAQRAEGEPMELKPLVVKSVEIRQPEAVLQNNMQPIPPNANISPVNPIMARDLQPLGAPSENKKAVEVYSFAEQAPRVERPVKREAQAAVFENTVNMVKQQEIVPEPVPAGEIRENNNDRILRLHKEGVSNVDIAKELGLGVGEVKLVINLFKGAV